MNTITTQLFYDAVQKGDLETAKSVHATAAPGDIDLAFSGSFQMTALHHAAEAGYIAMVGFLMELGANPDDRNSEGDTPLDLCKAQPAADIIVNVLKRRAELLEAAKSGNVSLARAALAGGGRINLPDPKGKTALHHAVHVRTSKKYSAETRHRMVKFLLDNGAKPNTLTTEGTPLQAALGMEDIPMAKMLITAGANVNTVNQDGTPTLFCATTIEAFELLVANGADPATQDGMGRSMLHRTAEKGTLPLMRHLMEKHGMQSLLNAPDALGRTPLYLAAKNKQVEAIRFLKAQPGIRYVPDNNGTTPAMTTNNKDVRALLKDMERASASPAPAPACKPTRF